MNGRYVLPCNRKISIHLSSHVNNRGYWRGGVETFYLTLLPPIPPILYRLSVLKFSQFINNAFSIIHMEAEIGYVEHYFSKIGVAAIKITDGMLKPGDRILIRGATTNFEQVVTSMEINRQKIDEAKPGDEIGIKVMEKVREGDRVYKVE